MEKVRENVQDMSLIKEDSVTQISPKCPRTDWIKNCSEKLRFDLSATFQNSNSSEQKNAELLCTSECCYSGYEKPQEPEDTEITTIPIAGLMSLLPEDEHTGSSRATLDTLEGCTLLLVQPEVTNCDKLGSCSLDDAGGELAKFHTVPDAAPDTSSHPDCKLLLESLEDEPPGGCNLPDGNGDEEEMAQCSVGQIKAFSSTSDEEIRCQHGCTHGEMQDDPVFCDTCSLSVKAEMCIQKMEDDGTSTFWSDYTNTTSLNINVVVNHSGKLDQGVENEENKLELQICGSEDVAVSETKGQVNESSLNKNGIHCEAEGSTVNNNVVSSRNIVTENVNLEADVFSGAKAEHAAGEMIAKARCEMADHTPETPAPARISQEPAEGDNNVSSSRVTDPAIWNETDREAVRGHSSQCTVGAELSPSLTVRETKMSLLLFDVTRPQDASFLGQTQQFNHPCRTQLCKDCKDIYQACSPSTNVTLLKTGNEGHCLWKTCLSCSPKRPPVLNGREESLETVRHSIKERNLSGCFYASLETLKAQVFKGLECETFKKDGSTKIKREESSDENEKSEKTEFNKGGEDSFKISELSGFGHRLLNVGSTNLSSKTEITMEKERHDEASVICETLVTKDGHYQENQKQTSVIRAFPDCFSQCLEGNICDSSKALASALPTQDAVVPWPQEVNPSYHAPTITPALNCSDTLSPLPSAFTLGDRVPAGFDTFQKIQLSLEDDGKSDYSGSNSPLHTSLSGPRRLYHSILEAESTNQHEVAPEEEEEGKDVERFKCHTENRANLSSDYSCNDVPNLTTTQIRSPRQHVNGKSVVSPSNNICDHNPASHQRDDMEFDTKKQFDMVLKELHLYFEISVGDFISVGPVSVPKQCTDVTRALEEETSEEFFSPDLMPHENAASGEFKKWLCSNLIYCVATLDTSDWWQ